MQTNKKRKPKRLEWQPTAKRYVGFVDIMGFKDMLLRLSHNEVYLMMQKVSESLLTVQSTYSIDYDSEADFDLNVKMILYSDSIMIFTRDDQQNSLVNLIASISALSESLLSDGIPHKGALALGEMTLDFKRSIFFGQPLVDAYLLQEELKFYGIAVHGTAEKDMKILMDESIIEYNCAFKNGFARHLTIVPGLCLNEEFEEESFDILTEDINKMRGNTSGSLRKYIDNTIDYIEFVRNLKTQLLREELDSLSAIQLKTRKSQTDK